MLFGPAYKGIPLAAAVAIALAQRAAISPLLSIARRPRITARGGSIVGAALKGRVLIVDDVISAGTSVRESVELIRDAGATPAGVLIALDRMERAGRTLGGPGGGTRLWHPRHRSRDLTTFWRFSKSSPFLPSIAKPSSLPADLASPKVHFRWPSGRSQPAGCSGQPLLLPTRPLRPSGLCRRFRNNAADDRIAFSIRRATSSREVDAP